MNETEEEKTSEWAKLRQKLADDGATVMHLPTRVIGKVARHYDGDADKWQDPNGVYVVTPVLKLDNNHAFVASDQKDFITLDEQAAAFYKSATQDTAIFVSKLAMAAGMMKPQMPLSTCATLLSSMLREQARALDMAARQSTQKKETEET